MGATLTALHLHDTSVDIAEVGDSRAYLLRDGQILQLTRDQSYVQLLVDIGSLTPEEAATAPLKSVIINAMGQKPEVAVAFRRLELRQRDCLLVCSDGLSNLVSDEEMQREILAAPGLDVAGAALAALARARGGPDSCLLLDPLGLVLGPAPRVRKRLLGGRLGLVDVLLSGRARVALTASEAERPG